MRQRACPEPVMMPGKEEERCACFVDPSAKVADEKCSFFKRRTADRNDVAVWGHMGTLILNEADIRHRMHPRILVRGQIQMDFWGHVCFHAAYYTLNTGVTWGKR